MHRRIVAADDRKLRQKLLYACGRPPIGVAYMYRVRTPQARDVRTADSAVCRRRSAEFLDPRTDGGSFV